MQEIQIFLQIGNYGEWLLVNEKSDVNGEPKWKPTRSWPHQ